MNREQRTQAVEELQGIRADLGSIRQGLERYRDALETHDDRRARRRQLVRRFLPFRRAA